MSFRPDQKLQVQQATDLVRLIGEQVALRPRGREFIGLCPFHDDKNPSLYVSPAKQIYKCFSCGAGGDAFSFVMNYHKMTFPEAIKLLADKAGIRLVEESRPEGQREGPTDRQRIAKANNRAVSFYRGLLRHPEHGSVARAYIAKRGISDPMVELFQLGYAPDRWDGLALTIREKNWAPEDFALAGLISPRDRNGGDVAATDPDSAVRPSATGNRPSHYDRLRHRLIFPILDSLGRPIAFGGRKLREEDEPKYLNSPETALFNKSATLYGIHAAKQPIIAARTAVIVEGYTDVIACHQAGHRNVVATLGTALTPQHITELRRYADKVVLIYDADEAGHKAADRAVEIFLAEQMDVAIAVLPEGLDPADLFQRPDGSDLWQRSIEQASDALDFMLAVFQKSFGVSTSVTGRQRLAESFIEKLVSLGLSKAPTTRFSLIVARLADILRMPLDTINDHVRSVVHRDRNRRVLGRALAQAGNRQSESTSDGIRSPFLRPRDLGYKQAQKEVIGCLLRCPSALVDTGLDEVLALEDFSGDVAYLYRVIFNAVSDKQPLTLASLLGHLAETGLAGLAEYATDAEHFVEAASEADPERERTILEESAYFIYVYRKEQSEYEKAKQEVLSLPSKDRFSDAAAVHLRGIHEFLKAHRSPPRSTRVGDVRSSPRSTTPATEAEVPTAAASTLSESPPRHAVGG